MNSPEVTGNVYPQISSHKGWCWENYEFLSRLRPTVLPEEQFILDYLVLDKKARLTNILSDGILSWGFIVDDKAKKVFDDAMLPPHKYFEAHVHAKDSVFKNYFWLFPVSEAYSDIDFTKSTFRITEYFLKKDIIEAGVTFNDIDGIREYGNKNAGHRVRPEKIKFINDIPLDLFQLGAFSFDWIITQRLKDQLEENKIAGAEMKAIDWLE